MCVYAHALNKIRSSHSNPILTWLTIVLPVFRSMVIVDSRLSNCCSNFFVCDLDGTLLSALLTSRGRRLRNRRGFSGSLLCAPVPGFMLRIARRQQIGIDVHRTCVRVSDGRSKGVSAKNGRPGQVNEGVQLVCCDEGLCIVGWRHGQVCGC